MYLAQEMLLHNLFSGGKSVLGGRRKEGGKCKLCLELEGRKHSAAAAAADMLFSRGVILHKISTVQYTHMLCVIDSHVTGVISNLSVVTHIVTCNLHKIFIWDDFSIS